MDTPLPNPLYQTPSLIICLYHAVTNRPYSLWRFFFHCNQNFGRVSLPFSDASSEWLSELLIRRLRFQTSVDCDFSDWGVRIMCTKTFAERFNLHNLVITALMTEAGWQVYLFHLFFFLSLLLSYAFLFSFPFHSVFKFGLLKKRMSHEAPVLS